MTDETEQIDALTSIKTQLIAELQIDDSDTENIAFLATNLDDLNRFFDLHRSYPESEQMTETLQMLDDIQILNIRCELPMTSPAFQSRNDAILAIAEHLCETHQLLTDLDDLIALFD